PEEYYNNNIIETSFRVEADKINPVLDVVFDGVHIMDGDIVSPSPLITISIKDENKFLFKNNTDGMEVFLKRPGRDEFEKIELSSNPDIISAGQVGGKINQYVIQYNPKNLPDGIYTLRVQGTDASGNKSGTEHYEIRFEVINKSTITHFYPYPNPFSTSTRFVFTLTGSEIPEDLKIQIMTVSGKVVREITKSELGPIRIGNNKTDFAWDGTDEFGDRLANGVYLYRVIIKNKGENFSHRDSSGDRAFKKEFGKLYILR
ncbi:MAG TPA: T9SS type A sorting domain-containing protein, partial [Cytophagaceae bacterium]